MFLSKLPNYLPKRDQKVQMSDGTLELPCTLREYELVELLGKGGFSHVYKAHDKTQDMFVAVKIVSRSRIRTPGDEHRLQREIDTMAFLKHKNVVSLHDFFEDENNFYLVLDYCEGGSLYDLIRTGVRMREPQVATVFRQIVEAVAFCHARGVAHRDLKPQNVLITTMPNIKVSDFGLCGYIDEKPMMNSFCGSPCYAAPECLNHVEYDGRKADVWSLGVILFELVTGEHPWNIANTAQMLQQIRNGSYVVPVFVSSACSDLIGAMLTVEPDSRIPLSDILAHPWLKLASKKMCQYKDPARSSLPRLSYASVHEMAQAIQHEHTGTIVSPFSALNVSANRRCDIIPRHQRMVTANLLRRGLNAK